MNKKSNVNLILVAAIQDALNLFFLSVDKCFLFKI